MTGRDHELNEEINAAEETTEKKHNVMTKLQEGELNEEISATKEIAEKKHTVMTKLQEGDANDLGEVTKLSMRITWYKYWKPALRTLACEDSWTRSGGVVQVHLPNMHI